jgi:hypothetical protein
MTRRICSKCGIEKSLDEFYLRRGSIDGYRNDCKECFNEGAKNIEKIILKK